MLSCGEKLAPAAEAATHKVAGCRVKPGPVHTPLGPAGRRGTARHAHGPLPPHAAARSLALPGVAGGLSVRGGRNRAEPCGTRKTRDRHAVRFSMSGCTGTGLRHGLRLAIQLAARPRGPRTSSASALLALGRAREAGRCGAVRAPSGACNARPWPGAQRSVPAAWRQGPGLLH